MIALDFLTVEGSASSLPKLVLAEWASTERCRPKSSGVPLGTAWNRFFRRKWLISRLPERSGFFGIIHQPATPMVSTSASGSIFACYHDFSRKTGHFHAFFIRNCLYFRQLHRNPHIFLQRRRRRLGNMIST
jgi:hypothetical protein